jgi:hypothetical protein
VSTSQQTTQQQQQPQQYPQQPQPYQQPQQQQQPPPQQQPQVTFQPTAAAPQQAPQANVPAEMPSIPSRDTTEMTSRIGAYTHYHIPFSHDSDTEETASLYSSDSGYESTGSELDIRGYISEINTCYGSRAADIAHRCLADIIKSRPDEKHMFTCANADVANALLTQN